MAKARHPRGSPVICVLDTESTGLPSNSRARVVEVGAVVLDPHDDYAEVANFGEILRPFGFDERDAKGLERSGISVEEVFAAESETTIRRWFDAFLRTHSVTEVFSYNRTFDETMLKRSGFVLPWTGCVMKMARAAMPARKKDPPLDEAVAYFVTEIPAGTAHRALPDARYAALLFAALRRRGH